MKKILLSFAVAIMAFGAANAQKSSEKSSGKSLTWGVGVRLAMPIGDASNTTGFGVGGEFQGEYMMSENMSLLGSVGYTSFMGKDYDYTAYGQTVKIAGKSSGVVPILVGFRYYPSTQFFVGAKVGYAVFTASGATGGFNYEPQIGYNGSKIQVSVGYNGISQTGSTFSTVGLSGIYKFN